MANELSATVTRSITAGGLTIGGVVDTLAINSIQTFRQKLTKNLTVEVDITLTVANAKLIAIEADQACTFNTNTTNGATGDSLALLANVPIIWEVNDPAALIPLTTDVTKVYVVANVTNDTIVKIAFGSDQTPVQAG